MATFLDRYQQGECEAVWAELTALGESVRKAAVLLDAEAVAKETMLRVRHNINIETLIPRLEEIGYHFGYDWLEQDERSFAKWQPLVFAPPTTDVLKRIIELETYVGPPPLSLRAWYETVGALTLLWL
jgi:hypothetical protein